MYRRKPLMAMPLLSSLLSLAFAPTYPVGWWHSSPVGAIAMASGAQVAVAPIFGVHVVFGRGSTPDAAVVRSLGAKVTTLWLYPTAASRFNVNQASQLVDWIREQTGGLEIYVHLMPNARSEAGGGSEGDPEGSESGRGFTLPGDMTAYLDSVQQLATALKGKVTYYSIGNEVSGFSWKGTVEDYGTLLSQRATAIKSVDPNGKILDSGMAGLTYAVTIPNSLYQAGKTAEAMDFLRRYTQNHAGYFSQFLPVDNEAQLQALLADPMLQKTIQLSNARFEEYCSYYDIFQLHDYQGWETMEEVYHWVQEQMQTHNCVKPIQAWEIGYGLDKNFPYDVNEHARTVTKILTISAAAGAQTIIYFPLSDKGTYARALLEQDGRLGAPARAYQVAVEKLADAVSAEKLNLGEGVWAYKFGRTRGDEVYVLWATDANTVSLPMEAWEVTVTDHLGGITTADPAALTVGPDPLFVEAKCCARRWRRHFRHAALFLGQDDSTCPPWPWAAVARPVSVWPTGAWTFSCPPGAGHFSAQVGEAWERSRPAAQASFPPIPNAHSLGRQPTWCHGEKTAVNPAVSPTGASPAEETTPQAPTGRSPRRFLRGRTGSSSPTLTQNPFGVMLPSQLVRSPGGMEVAKKLRAVYFRPPSIFLDQWNGTCTECDIALNGGLKLVLTVRNSGPGPTSPPGDLAAYQRILSAILDKYRPALLAVENEENSRLFYTGTPQEYGAQLKAACQVAHQKGVPCTNGGLVSTLVALLVYDHYVQTGQEAAAQDFAKRAFAPEVRRQLTSARAREQITKGKALLQVYRSGGVDFVNFHWYGADPRSLGEAVAYLKLQTGLPVITNEVGQFTDDPRQTTAIMAKVVELGLPIAVWFGVDGPKARGLVNMDGSLRPTGVAFQRFIEQHFP